MNLNALLQKEYVKRSVHKSITPMTVQFTIIQVFQKNK